MFRTTLIAATFVTFGMPALAVDCADWNTWGFFETVSADDVVDCVAAGADINARNESGRTPLRSAALKNENPEVIAALIAAGADVNETDKYGETPLHWAAKYNENPAVIEALIAEGADISAKDSDGELPFDLAAKNTAIKNTNVYWVLNEGRFSD
jgi:ankyrin repeat protein